MAGHSANLYAPGDESGSPPPESGGPLPKSGPQPGGQASGAPSPQAPCRRPDPDDTLAHVFAAIRAGAPVRFDGFEELPELPEEVRDRVRHRFEVAWAEGWLRLSAEQYCDVLMVLLPEDHVISLPATPASQDALGTTGRLAAYAERALHREAIFDPADAEAVRDDRKAVRARARPNGTGVQSAGFLPEESPPASPGMYRNSAGHWFELN